MKDGIHPNYREVCFQDMSNGFKFVTRSWHPFYTGTQKSVDNMGGRVERFRNRFGKTTTIAK